MKVHSFHIANSAEVRDSLLYELGGYPEWWNVSSLPFASSLALVLVVEHEAPDLGNEQVVEISLRRPSSQDADEIGKIQMRRDHDGDHPEGAPFIQVVVFPFWIEFKDIGPHEFVATQNGSAIGTASLAVRLTS